MRSFVRVFVAGLVAAAVGVSGVSACVGELQTEQAEMACCKAMREICAKQTSTVNCCQTERDGHQKATAVAANAPGKTSIQHLISTSAVELIALTAPALRIASPTDSVDRYRPHSPPYLRHSALRI